MRTALVRYQADISMIYQKDIDTGFIRLIRADTRLISLKGWTGPVSA